MNDQAHPHLMVVDVGNSAIKAAWLPPSQPPATLLGLQAMRVPATQPLDVLSERLPPEPCRWVVVGVRRQREAELRRWIQRSRPGDQYQVLQNQQFGLRLDVKWPERVGADRLAAARAARELGPAGQGAIVVDVGTAVTVDRLSGDGTFCGGAILPGPATAAAALAQCAEALPALELTRWVDLPAPVGRSTEQAILSGLQWGCVGAIRELVTQYTRSFRSLPRVFCTGGGGQPVARQLGPHVRCYPNLVLFGAALAAWQSLQCG
jgi:type III pantothenate kinase